MLTFCVPAENKSKRELIRMLVQKGYESDPVVAWTKAQEKVLLQGEGTMSKGDPADMKH